MFLSLAAILGLAAVGANARQPSHKPEPAWRQWGGPNRNFIVDSATLADTWPDGGPRVNWSRPLGTGTRRSSSDDGRLYTMYRRGQRPGAAGAVGARKSPSSRSMRPPARRIWEHKYPSRREDFSFGAGPHSTPLIVGDRLFTIGTNKQLFAFDKKTGKILWSHDLIKEFNSPELLIRPVVKTGYGCSPIAFRDTIICSVGGPGQSVMAFRQSDGSVVWKSGDFLTSEAAPILIEFAGPPSTRDASAAATVNGLDPADRHGPVVAPARSGQRPQLRHADLGAGQHPVRVVGVQGGQPRDPS